MAEPLVMYKSKMEGSVRRGEQVLRELFFQNVAFQSEEVNVEAEVKEINLNLVPAASPLSDSETKGSEGDSGIGQETSGSGAGWATEEEAARPESKSDSEADTSMEEQLWEIEKILNYEQRTRTYRVKWKDWHDDFNTWEPIDNLLNCDEELLRFYLDRKATRKVAVARTTFVTVNRKRRRQGPSWPDVPPDPRPLQSRTQEFYKVTQLPTQEEIDESETKWKRLLASKNNRAIWPTDKLDQYLDDGMTGNLTASEQKDLREQLLLLQFDSLRQTVLTQLKEWEVDMNLVTRGLPKISVENDVDLTGPPIGFSYINDYASGDGVTIPDEPPLGCSCTNCLQTKKDCCAHQSSSQFAYSHYKRVRVSIGTPIFECNKTCKCGPECCNRVVQDGQVSLKNMCYTIYRTSNGCGWGVKTQRLIKRGTFVSLYVGEVITTAESDRRSKEYDAEGCTYLFDLDFNDTDSFPYAVDAARCGNVSHFINHSCDPNLAVFAVWVNCLDPNLPMLALFAIKDIQNGTQLTFDYMNHSSNSTDAPGFVSEGKHTKKSCLCESENCRKFLFV